MSESKRIYGIDLGTTYSCISYVDEHGKPTVVANAEGQPTTPSVVYFEGPENIVVGSMAKDVAVMHPEKVVSTVKRVMGDKDWVYDHAGKIRKPQDVSSYILRKLVADAEVVTGDKITDVVITCPAYFGLNEKEATRQAGVLAGLNVRYVIPEPTAAAIAYGFEQKEEQVILVYDLGGGTFDITLLAITPTDIEVICTGGDHQLGGKNWDETIATWFAEQFAAEKGGDASSLMGDLETWQDLLKTAEAAKQALSSREKYPARITHGGERASIELTREKFDELTANLLERTLSLTEELLATAKGKGYAKIDKLLLVGGSTYMPQVLAAVPKKFPFEVKQFDPNQAVAKGAALFGYKCFLDDQVLKELATRFGGDTTKVDQTKVTKEERQKAEAAVAKQQGLALPALQNLTAKKVRNVTSKSFGVVIMDVPSKTQRVQNLIVVDQQVPVQISQPFQTYEANQQGVNVRCMENLSRNGIAEGSIPLDESSRQLGVGELRFAKALPKDSPIRLDYALSEDGLLNVHAVDLTTDQVLKMDFKTDSVYSQEELEEALSENMSMVVS